MKRELISAANFLTHLIRIKVPQNDHHPNHHPVYRIMMKEGKNQVITPQCATVQVYHCSNILQINIIAPHQTHLLEKQTHFLFFQ